MTTTMMDSTKAMTTKMSTTTMMKAMTTTMVERTKAMTGVPEDEMKRFIKHNINILQKN